MPASAISRSGVDLRSNLCKIAGLISLAQSGKQMSAGWPFYFIMVEVHHVTCAL